MQIVLPIPNDFHCHLREILLLSWMLRMLVDNGFRGKNLDMPNTKKPILRASHAIRRKRDVYRELNKMDIEGMSALKHPSMKEFEIIFTMQVTERTTPKMIRAAVRAGITHFKIYPKDVTTNSEHGVVDYRKIYPALREIGRLGAFAHFHGEHPSYTVEGFAKEDHFLKKILKPILVQFPHFKVILEHISTREAVEFVKYWFLVKKRWIAGTITPHHLVLAEDDVIGYSEASHCKTHLEHACKPCLKRRPHMYALQRAAVAGLPCFFLGTDTAPHLDSAKFCHDGSCGVFNTGVAIPAILGLFERKKKLNSRAVGYFVSHAGADFFGIPRSKGEVTFVRLDRLVFRFPVPGTDDFVTPMWLGQIAEWMFKDVYFSV